MVRSYGGIPHMQGQRDRGKEWSSLAQAYVQVVTMQAGGETKGPPGRPELVEGAAPDCSRLGTALLAALGPLSGEVVLLGSPDLPQPCP